MHPVSDSDIQLVVTGKYSHQTDSEFRQSVIITGPNSANEGRKPRAKRLFREKTVDGSSQTRNAVNSTKEPSPTPSMRAPTVSSLQGSDFGHTFYVNLLDVHTLYGRLCVTQLCSRYLKPSKTTDESDSDSRPIALTLSKQWFVVTTIPVRDSSKSKSVLEILLAVPTKSIFAYSFETKRNM
ncbi:hypothetical protein FBUS_07195 [Fasciolopsis buskii]|uniref:PH-like domain-containing protein n=1 Tax=Fasciolopsis buskii TaxID=27845 RepID=A0A8E0S4R8_9TREM|nr:hypothetical protein FBUS_07195 [Fasciolopsis buski]